MTVSVLGTVDTVVNKVSIYIEFVNILQMRKEETRPGGITGPGEG